MKYLLILTLLFSSHVYSKETSPHPEGLCASYATNLAHGKPVDDSPSLGPAEIHKAENSTRIERLGESLCGSYVNGDDIVVEMRASVTNAMKGVKKDPDFEPSDREMFDFLNEHTNKLTCSGKHYLAVAFDLGVYNTVYKDFLKIDSDKPDAFKINFNSVTVTWNHIARTEEPMTVLDYVHHVMLKDPAVIRDTDASDDMKYIRKVMRKKNRHHALFYEEIKEICQ